MELPYSFSLNPGLARPTVMLRQPILVEVFGGGFTKAPRSKVHVNMLISHACLTCVQYYELRFPRMTKFHRASERSWTEGCSLEKFQRIARESVGRDRPNKDVDDWCKGLWGKTPSPSIRSSVKRKERETEWIEKLTKVDGKPRAKARRIDLNIAVGGSKQAENMRENGIIAINPSSPTTSPRLRAFGSVTNVLTALSQPAPETSPATIQLPTPMSSANPPRKAVSVSACAVSLNSVSFHQVAPSRDQLGQDDAEKPQPSLKNLDLSANASASYPIIPTLGRSKVSPKQFSPNRPCTIRQFLQYAVVYLVRDMNVPRPSWRVPSRAVVPHGHQVYSTESLLVACGWTSEGHSCDWAQYGVVFVDDTSPGSLWVDVLNSLVNTRAAALRGGRIPDKAIVILSISLLKIDTLDQEAVIPQRAICRLGELS
jgi:DNA ligase 4